MHIYNLKINSKLLYKIIIGALLISTIFIVALISFKIFKTKTVKVKDDISFNFKNVTPSNYTNTLELIHKDLNSYIGKEFKFSGYIYRVYDFTENQFVLARDMIISTDFQTMVVGFLCSYENAYKFTDNCWVEIEGIIQKTDYYGEIPIIQVKTMKKINKPDNEFVYPPK